MVLANKDLNVQEDLKSESPKSNVLENKFCFFAFAVEQTSKSLACPLCSATAASHPVSEKDSTAETPPFGQRRRCQEIALLHG
jgi:hypothetical protein